MERKTSPMPLMDLSLTAGEESAPSSQVLEIHPEALLTPDQPDEADVWLMEEGDDSVFYSDEEQTNQDMKPNASWESGAKKGRRLVNSEARSELTPQGECDPGAAIISDKENKEMSKEVSMQDIWADQELQNQKTQGRTRADTQTQAKPIISSATANVLIGKEEEEKFLEQKPSSELQTSHNRKLKPDQDQDCHAPEECHQDRSPGPKTSGQSASDLDSFDHLTSSKYSTVSYRRIRRGNTRQKIQEFEHMIINM